MRVGVSVSGWFWDEPDGRFTRLGALCAMAVAAVVV